MELAGIVSFAEGKGGRVLVVLRTDSKARGGGRCDE